MSSIKNILKARSELFLVVVGAIIAAIILSILVWGVSRLARDIGVSLSTPGDTGAEQQFNLDAAAELDLRGQQAQ